MLKYELVVILDPARTEEQQAETLAKIEAVITKNGGTIDKRDVWGKRRLSYLVKKRREGYYTILTFDGPSTGPLLSEVDRICRITEEILRFLLTRAVVGKSAGNPGSYREQERAPSRYGSRGGAPSGAPPAAAAPADASAAPSGEPVVAAEPVS